MSQEKIKRALLWIRKALDITERTKVPDKIDSKILPILDVFGWERYREALSVEFTASNSSSVLSTAVPDDTMRLIVSAGIQTTNNLVSFQFWFEHTVAFGGETVSLQRPFIAPIGSGNVRIGLERPVLLSPGDVFGGRASAAVGAGEVLLLRLRFMDLKVGEYAPAL